MKKNVSMRKLLKFGLKIAFIVNLLFFNHNNLLKPNNTSFTDRREGQMIIYCLFFAILDAILNRKKNPISFFRHPWEMTSLDIGHIETVKKKRGGTIF